MLSLKKLIQKLKGDILKKRDFEYLFENKFGGRCNGNNIYTIPICNGEAYLCIDRITIMREANYRFCIPPVQFKWNSKYKDLAKDLYQSPDWSYVYETAESLAFFDKYLNILKNENPNNLNTVLKLMFTEMKSVQTMSLNTLSQSR